MSPIVLTCILVLCGGRQEARHAQRQLLIEARANNFRPSFSRSDCVRITDKANAGYGYTGVILRMEGGSISRLGAQAMVVLDHNSKVVSVPVFCKETDAGIRKYGFHKVPGLWIQPVPGTLSANSQRRLHEVRC